MTREIPLSKGHVALVDDNDYEWLSQWKWCYSPSSKGRGYAGRTEYRRNDDGTFRLQHLLMHRVIMDAPKGSVVDHVDLNTLNNTRANLRLCTHTENSHNKRSKTGSTSQYKGVSLSKNGFWKAGIRVDKQLIHLGYYDIETAAALAYDHAAREHFGSFARLNFPDSTEAGVLLLKQPLLSHLTWLELSNEAS